MRAVKRRMLCLRMRGVKLHRRMFSRTIEVSVPILGNAV